MPDILIQGLTSNKDAEIRSRILAEMDSKLTFQKIAEECQRIVNLKLDTLRIEKKDNSQVHSVQPSKRKNYKRFFNS